MVAQTDHRAFKETLYGQFARIGKALASPQRLELFRAHGRRARRLAEGFPEWRAAGLPIETGAPKEEP